AFRIKTAQNPTHSDGVRVGILAESCHQYLHVRSIFRWSVFVRTACKFRYLLNDWFKAWLLEKSVPLCCGNEIYTLTITGNAQDSPIFHDSKRLQRFVVSICGHRVAARVAS